MCRLTIVSTAMLFGGLLVTSTVADFFSDLDKLDVDAQLNEIDRMMEKIDKDEEGAIETLTGRKSKSKQDTSADAVTDALADLFGGECKYSCKNGATPKPNLHHKPTSNGCGSFGIEFELDGLPEMTVCCNKHDICYDTCNTDRGNCDKQFKKCLHGMCDKIKPSVTKQQYQGCKDTANLMYTGTTALGCSPFLESQENACVCGDPVGKSTKSGYSESSDRKSDSSKSGKFSDSKQPVSKRDGKDVKNQNHSQNKLSKQNQPVKETTKDTGNENKKQKSGRRNDEL